MNNVKKNLLEMNNVRNYSLIFAFRSKTVGKTDQRVNTMNEIISSMQVTKMYTWENSFANMIYKLRK